MTELKIERLRIRVPAGAASRPESLASEVSARLAAGAAGLEPARLASLKVVVPLGTARGDTLAGRIAAQVHAAICDKGGR